MTRPRVPWYRYWERTVEEDAAARGATAAADDPGGGADAVPANGTGEPEAPVFHVEPPAAGANGGRTEESSSPPAQDAAFHVEHPPPAPEPGQFERAFVLTIANQKGGVGKTTTAVSLSAALADLGSRVLLVDLDPQSNATSGVGVQVAPGQSTVYDVLIGEADVADAIIETNVTNLAVVPSTLDLAGAEIELVTAFNREQQLRRALEPARAAFDLVVVDCPPSLGLLTVNALTAGDGLLVPIQCEYYALEGLGALRRNADLIRSQLNPDLEVTGFVLTMLDARTRLSQQVVEEVRAHFGDRVFTTRIPRSVRLAEAPGFGQPITVFDPSSRGAMAYRRLATELLGRLAGPRAAGDAREVRA